MERCWIARSFLDQRMVSAECSAQTLLSPELYARSNMHAVRANCCPAVQYYLKNEPVALSI